MAAPQKSYYTQLSKNRQKKITAAAASALVVKASANAAEECELLHQ